MLIKIKNKKERWKNEIKKPTKFLLVFGIIFVAFLLFNTNNVQASTTAKGNIYKANTHEELNKKMGIDGEWYDFADKYDDRYYGLVDKPLYLLDVRFSDKDGLDLTKNMSREVMSGINGYYEENASVKNKDIYLTFVITYNNGEDVVDLGNSITINGLGTFVKNDKLNTGFNKDGMTRYQTIGYQMKITDTSIFNNKYLGFDIEIQTDDMAKIVTGLYQVSISDEKSEDNTNTTIKNEETNIELKADTNVVPSNTKLEAKEIKAEKVLNVVKESLKEISNKYISYDITLKSNGVAIQPNGKVKISIPIPSNFDKTKLSIFRIADDGTKIKYDTKVENNVATIETDHFSTYVLAENNIVANNEQNNTISNQEENKDTTKSTETKKGEKDETPKTGTIDIIGYILLVSVLSGIGIVALKKKIK